MAPWGSPKAGMFHWNLQQYLTQPLGPSSLPQSTLFAALFCSMTRCSALAIRSNISVRTGDAAAHIADIARRGSQPLDLVFLDAFDGDDCVPEPLCSPGTALELTVLEYQLLHQTLCADKVPKLLFSCRMRATPFLELVAVQNS